MIMNFDIIQLLDSIFGMIIASIIFIIPKLMKQNLGWGDIKYSSVLGFSLGVVHYIYGMITAMAFALLYCGFRKLVIKKDIKDFPLPLGSFMSMGVIFICVFEFISQTLHL